MGPHGDQADVVPAADLVGKYDVDLHVERTVGHIDLQTSLPDRRDMFLVDVDERQVVSRAREPAADNAADGAGADYDDTVAHLCLRVNAAKICNHGKSVKRFRAE